MSKLKSEARWLKRLAATESDIIEYKGPVKCLGFTTPEDNACAQYSPRSADDKEFAMQICMFCIGAQAVRRLEPNTKDCFFATSYAIVAYDDGSFVRYSHGGNIPKAQDNGHSVIGLRVHLRPVSSFNCRGKKKGRNPNNPNLKLQQPRNHGPRREPSLSVRLRSGNYVRPAEYKNA